MTREAVAQIKLDALLAELGDQLDKIARFLHEARDEPLRVSPNAAFMIGALYAELRFVAERRRQDYEKAIREAIGQTEACESRG